MPKHDYYDDPDAPAANSIVVAVTAIVRNDAGDVLLIERTDNGSWAAPGGALDIGERVTDTVAREVFEETGLRVEATGISGVYSDPGHVIAYDDGEVRQEFSLCFHARPTGGQLRTSSESRQVRWVKPNDLKAMKIQPAMRLRLQYALDHPQKPYLG